MITAQRSSRTNNFLLVRVGHTHTPSCVPSYPTSPPRFLSHIFSSRLLGLVALLPWRLAPFDACTTMSHLVAMPV